MHFVVIPWDGMQEFGEEEEYEEPRAMDKRGGRYALERGPQQRTLCDTPSAFDSVNTAETSYVVVLPLL